mmetsp:Transcript_40309/g.94413  ORF Transcript_40309/g.94413 Transcript_40309/m.94413 type:complete len:232 (+) Transcript_40309:2431-3126(+)
MEVQPLVLLVHLVLQNALLQVGHRIVQVFEAILRGRQDASHSQLLGQVILDVAPDHTNSAPFCLSCQLGHAHRSRGIHSIERRAVEEQELEPPVCRHLILVLILEILLHGPHDGHARTEEDVALEVHDQDPSRCDVHETLVTDLTDGPLACNHLVSALGSAIQRGHTCVLANEGKSRKNQSRNDGPNQLACRNEHDEDHNDLHPLTEMQELSGSPHVVSDKASTGEEQKRT